MSNLIKEHLDRGAVILKFWGRISDRIDSESAMKVDGESGFFLKFQKSFVLMDELKENQIIYTLHQDAESGQIAREVSSLCCY